MPSGSVNDTRQDLKDTFQIGEDKANMIFFGSMARRSTKPSSEQLTRAELETLRHRLDAMPRYELETFYKATHNACRYVVRLPSPRMIQELVQAWRALRRKS